MSCNLTQIYGKNETYFHIVVFFLYYEAYNYSIYLLCAIEDNCRSTFIIYLVYVLGMKITVSLSTKLFMLAISLSVSNKLCYLQLIVFILELSCWVDHYFVLDSSFGMVIN